MGVFSQVQYRTSGHPDKCPSSPLPTILLECQDQTVLGRQGNCRKEFDSQQVAGCLWREGAGKIRSIDTVLLELVEMCGQV